MGQVGAGERVAWARYEQRSLSEGPKRCNLPGRVALKADCHSERSEEPRFPSDEHAINRMRSLATVGTASPGLYPSCLYQFRPIVSHIVGATHASPLPRFMASSSGVGITHS